MRTLTLSFTLTALIALASPAHAEICGLMKAQTEAEWGDSSVTLFEGEILPVKSKSKTRNRFNLKLGGKTIVVPREVVKLLSGVKCAPRASTVPVAAETFLQPDASVMGPRLKPTTTFEVTSEIRVNGQTWLRIALDGQADYWMIKKDVREKAVAAPSGPRLWKFGAEFAQVAGLSSEAYDGLVTSIPDSGNVGQLQDPIITSVGKGSGYIIRIFGERPVWKLLRARVGLGYRSETYSYEYKTNPTLGTVTLGELSGSKRDIKINRVQLDGGLAVEHPFHQFQFSYGFQLGLLYNLSGEEEVNTLVPSGVFFKNTPAKVKAGPGQIEIETWLRGEARWRGAGLVLGLGLKGETMFGVNYSF